MSEWAKSVEEAVAWDEEKERKPSQISKSKLRSRLNSKKWAVQMDKWIKEMDAWVKSVHDTVAGITATLPGYTYNGTKDTGDPNWRKAVEDWTATVSTWAKDVEKTIWKP